MYKVHTEDTQILSSTYGYVPLAVNTVPSIPLLEVSGEAESFISSPNRVQSSPRILPFLLSCTPFFTNNVESFNNLQVNIGDKYMERYTPNTPNRSHCPPISHGSSGSR